MCGITGIINYNKPIKAAQLEAMCNALHLRGPDDKGLWVDKNIGLGHTRLSIIDLETGHQPMCTLDKNVIIVFNGEIYNFKELRAELKVLNIVFNTTSDTEVILKCYQQYGIEKTLSKLEGMFAFALYDKEKEELFIARDKFGEKPLYYFEKENEFYFGSEIKSLFSVINKKEIDTKGLNFFLSLSYIPAPYTIYKEVKKLLPAHYLAYKKGNAAKIHRYYNLLEKIEEQPIETDLNAAVENIKSKLKESVEKRMISDVPIGAFLSGGIDSSIIASLMAEISPTPINTFTIGFKEKNYDESGRAKLVADKIKSNHTVHYLDYKDIVDVIDDIINYYDEPFGDSSALPSYYVAKLAQEKVKVVLTGDCADELFGGYEKYLGQYYVTKFRKLPKLVQNAIIKLVNIFPHTKQTDPFLLRAKKVVQNVNKSNFDMHYSLMCLGFSDVDRSSLLLPKYLNQIKEEVKTVYNSFQSKEPLEKGFYTDLHFVLEGDMLTKVDRVCMKNSLEARTPFLDSSVVEMAYRLPLNFKIRGKNKKFILKKAFKNILPKETIGFRKQGFGVPVDYWLRNELKEDIKTLVSKKNIERQGIFNYEVINALLEEHITGKENHKGKLWNLYVFQKWYNKNFNIDPFE